MAQSGANLIKIRLVVDAALGLQTKLGYSVKIYTSHHEKTHCFKETINKLDVEVLGDFLPRSLFGYGHILFAILRNIYLALYLLFSVRNGDIDVLFVDQISAAIPFMRLISGVKSIVFYCHFPDLLLSKPSGMLKKIYRIPFNLLEELTTCIVSYFYFSHG